MAHIIWTLGIEWWLRSLFQRAEDRCDLNNFSVISALLNILLALFTLTDCFCTRVFINTIFFSRRNARQWDNFVTVVITCKTWLLIVFPQIDTLCKTQPIVAVRRRTGEKSSAGPRTGSRALDYEQDFFLFRSVVLYKLTPCSLVIYSSPVNFQESRHWFVSIQFCLNSLNARLLFFQQSWKMEHFIEFSRSKLFWLILSDNTSRVNRKVDTQVKQTINLM